MLDFSFFFLNLSSCFNLFWVLLSVKVVLLEPWWCSVLDNGDGGCIGAAPIRA